MVGGGGGETSGKRERLGLADRRRERGVLPLEGEGGRGGVRVAREGADGERWQAGGSGEVEGVKGSGSGLERGGKGARKCQLGSKRQIATRLGERVTDAMLGHGEGGAVTLSELDLV